MLWLRLLGFAFNPCAPPHRSNKILILSKFNEFRLREIFGGKGIRTPDFQLAKLALYQLSYAPTEKLRVIG